MATERRDFTEEEKSYAWNRCKTIEGKDPDKWRQDYAGAYMWWIKYGDTDSQYGWEIDHIKPLDKDGTYEKTNLVAMQWENNRHKDNNYPRWETNRSFDGENNVEVIKHWKAKQ